MATPHIRIFPHSREEFTSVDVLTTWLMTPLPARGMRYWMRSGNSVADLPRGSVVLFRYNDAIVGEGIVREYVREEITDRTMTGEEQHYEARVDFAPGSVRVLGPPFPIRELQSLVGQAVDITVPRGYYIISDWHVYPRMLAAHLDRTGIFI